MLQTVRRHIMSNLMRFSLECFQFIPIHTASSPDRSHRRTPLIRRGLRFSSHLRMLLSRTLRRSTLVHSAIWLKEFCSFKSLLEVRRICSTFVGCQPHKNTAEVPKKCESKNNRKTNIRTPEPYTSSQLFTFECSSHRCMGAGQIFALRSISQWAAQID